MCIVLFMNVWMDVYKYVCMDSFSYLFLGLYVCMDGLMYGMDVCIYVCRLIPSIFVVGS